MCKLKKNLIASIEGGDKAVGKIAICYQKDPQIANEIAKLLPYPTLVLNGKESFEDIAGEMITHVIELYQPAGEAYEKCVAQRKRFMKADCQILTLFDWQAHYLEDAFWGDTDYLIQAEKLNKIVERLKKVEMFHITSDIGTNICFSVKGQRWIVANGLCRNDELSQMPDGEIYTCPIEETFEGVLVVDGTITRSWVPNHPERLEFKAGKLVKCSERFAKYIKDMGPEIQQIGEFALGFNLDHMNCAYNISVDEKRAGTVHFALGDSYGLGKNKCYGHLDMLICHPKIKMIPEVDFSDGLD